MAETKNPHDAFFKQLFTRPGVARDFFEHYLPAELLDALALDFIEVVEGSFTDAELQEHLSDLIFRVRLKGGGQTLIYFLFEHKSAPDRWALWQALRYVMQLWEQEHAAGVEKLTPVVPIIFYHGRARWKFSPEFGALVEFAGFSQLREFVPGFRALVIDLAQLDDAQLVGGRLLRFGLSLMKYIFRRRELVARLAEFLALYQPLFSGHRWDFLFVGLKYLASVKPKLPREQMSQAVARVFTQPQEGAIMQSLADEWIIEGRKKGLQQGLLEGREQGLQQGRQQAAARFALRQLRHKLGRLAAPVERRVNALPVERLEELGLALFDFRTSQDLLAWLSTQPDHKA